MKSSILRDACAVACGIALSACSQGSGTNSPAAAASPAASAGSSASMSDDQKTLYAMGFIAGQQFAQFKFTPEEFAALSKGMAAACENKKPEIPVEAFQARINPFLEAKVAQARVANVGVAQSRKSADAPALAKAAAEPGATTLASGTIHQVLKNGSGPSPKATSTVSVHYEGKLVDGTVFDSSIQRGQPAEFALNGVIPCWAEGVARMKVGEKARLTCPSDAAYGDQGTGPIPPGATLIFEVELLKIVK